MIMNSQRENQIKGTVTIYALRGIPMFYDVYPKDSNFDLNDFTSGENVTWTDVINRLHEAGYEINNRRERVIV